MTFPWLGIDPGRTGAALLLSEHRRPLVLYCWRDRQQFSKGVYEVTVVTDEHQRREVVQDLHGVGLLLEASVARVLEIPTWGIAVEAPYVGRSARTGLIVAYQTGLIMGPLESRCRCERVYPGASTWRARLLGLPRQTKRDAAKAASLLMMPRRLPGLEGLLQRASGLLGVAREDLDHVTDAAGIAEYGFLFGTPKETKKHGRRTRKAHE